VEELLNLYKERKNDIKKSLKEFSRVRNANEKRIFSELCFCLCTPQSKALMCWEAIEKLDESGKLINGDIKEIQEMLRRVRFNKTKARRIVAARKKFMNGDLKIKEIFEEIEDDHELRKWLIENVDGFGMKEASHFMRNIGRGENVAILDRHILRNLNKYGILEKIPDNLPEKGYLEIEKKMKDFAKSIGISLAELDLLLWSKETGFIFK